MRRALSLAASVRTRTSPNPWVGALVVTPRGETFEGATAPPGGAHAEVVALRSAGARAQGATLYTTLEPCAHRGRTPPCTKAVVASGVSRVVVGVLDPDPQVSGRGVDELRGQGIVVDVGVAADEASELLAPYLKHRRTGRPWVVLKLAASMDGRIAAPDGSARWLTGDRRGPMRIGCGRPRTRFWSGRGPSGPTTPSSRSGSTRRPSTNRCASSSVAPPTGPRSTPRSSCRGSPAPCSTSSEPKASCRCSSRAEPASPTPSTPRGSSTGTCSTSPPPCSGEMTPCPCSAAPALPMSKSCGAVAWCRSRSLAPMCVSSSPPRTVRRRERGVTA